MKLTPLLFALPVLPLFSSCSTIVSGSMEEVHVRSTPSGAVVKADGISRGVTPAEFELTRKRDHVVTVEMAGYKPYEVQVKRGFNGWIIGNVAFGGLIGVAVDLSTGAVYALNPNEIDARLEPLPGRGRGARRAGVPTSRERLVVRGTREPKAGWQKVGQLERL